MTTDFGVVPDLTPEQEHESGAPALEAASERRAARRGFLVALPSFAYLVIFFAIPLVIVLVYSFATRNPRGITELRDWNVEAYRALAEPLLRSVLVRTLVLALLTTVICLALSYPFAYYMATRDSEVVRTLLLIGVMIPFWSNFLVRTYVIRVLLSSSGPLSEASQSIGLGEVDIAFSNAAVLIGLVYGFLPFMILPLYAALERIDWNLVEAARDLYASGWKAFRRVVWPLSRPGVVAGCILVFVPSFGAYVTSDILGGAKNPLFGNYIVNQFLQARDWPAGAAVSVVILAVMLIGTLVYFRTGGRTL
ncbi:MAG: Spermidine/putrescine transport system permease protein PotB [Acidimicrobiales bacterium]|nr:MAG: ABC transporter permease [Actinomycetota bacterium]MBV6509381.1 Spermidine/putrescine transport system permease protein PotB [Acidimicrobiales bacterium]RIK04586.1 MAG: spermidine/putrescine ABC transporter permease [Acidobacteriota bacterium]